MEQLYTAAFIVIAFSHNSWSSLKMEVSALIVDMKNGFIDLSLRMHAPSLDTGNGYRFEARALHEGRPIAFAVALGTTWLKP